MNILSFDERELNQAIDVLFKINPHVKKNYLEKKHLKDYIVSLGYKYLANEPTENYVSTLGIVLTADYPENNIKDVHISISPSIIETYLKK